MRKLTTTEFIEKAQLVHGEKYDYSLVNYIKSNEKVIIICPIHGKFEQRPNTHLNGCGCPVCYETNRTMTTQEFIERAKNIHGNKYDYSKVKYKSSKKNVIIICPEHGEFEQRASAHLFGQGCLKCGNMRGTEKRKLSLEEWKLKASTKHNNKYDYSLITEAPNTKDKVKIICPIHGEFEIRADMHVFGQECQKCSDIRKFTLKEWIEKASRIHNNKYDYSKVVYEHSQKKVIIICPEHGEFEQQANAHLLGAGCIKCVTKQYISEPENQLFSLLNNWNIFNINRNDRDTISPSELDLYLPDYKIGIEYCGLFWHSDFYRDNLYHQRKYLDCYKKGINLIQIFEDEWIYQEEKVIDKLKGYLNIQKDNVIDINQCITEEYDNQNTFDLWCFEEDNYLEIDDLRHEKSDINIVLKHNEEIVSILSLNKENDNKYIITRFFDKLNYQINDSFKTLLNWFIQNFKPSEISYLDDLRWSQEKLLIDNGFVFDKLIEPKEYWIDSQNRFIEEIEGKNSFIKNAGTKLFKFVQSVSE